MGERFDAQRLVELGRVGPVAPAPCGTWAAVQVDRLDADGAKYVSDLWRVPLDGGAALQLTRGDVRDRAPAFRADGALLFVSDRPVAKEERPRGQVWCLPATGGEPRPITDEPLGVDAFQVARIGERLVVQTTAWPGIAADAQRAHDDARRSHGPSARRYTRMPIRFWDHWLAEPRPQLVLWSGGARRPLTDLEDEYAYRSPEWHLAADGSRVVITVHRMGPERVEDGDLHVIDVASGATRLLTAGPRTQLEHPKLSADGRLLVCCHHARVGRPDYVPRMRVYDLEGDDAWRPLAPAWEVFPGVVGFDPGATAVFVCADDRGQRPIYRVPLSTGVPQRLIAPSVGGSHAEVQLTWDGGRLVGTRSHLLHPPEPFALALRPGAEPEIIAHLSGFDAAEAGAMTVRPLTTPGGGGTPVHGFVVTDPDAPPRRLLVWIHGGPMSQNANGWHWRWNPLVAAAAGFAVALPNPRGSTGYGQRFCDEIWGNTWGEACYEDVMAFTEASLALPGVDPIGPIAMGGSFGGYMTNLIGARTERFAALVSHAGIYHFPIFGSTTDDPGWFAWSFGFEPDTDPAAFTRYSPHRGVERWRTPTLIIHGEKDYRVPVSEALAQFEALQRHGVPSELLVFPDENHWILRPRNVVAWYDAWIDFVGAHPG